MKTFKFRLSPSKSQRTQLLKTLELCRWVFNETLATRKNAWEQEKKSITRFDTIKLLPMWKAEKPELSQVYSQVLQEVCTRVDLAFQSYFRRVKAHAEKAMADTIASRTHKQVLNFSTMVCCSPKSEPSK